MIILAFDLSTTNIGWLAGTDEGFAIQHHTIVLQGKTALDRLPSASCYIERIMHDINPDTIVYESQSGRGSPNSYWHSYVIGYVILHSLNRGIVPVAIAPCAAKKALTGKGTATKDMMVDAAKPFFDELSYTEHEADALGVFYAFLNKGNTPEKKPRRRKAKGAK